MSSVPGPGWLLQQVWQTDCDQVQGGCNHQARVRVLLSWKQLWGPSASSGEAGRDALLVGVCPVADQHRGRQNQRGHWPTLETLQVRLLGFRLQFHNLYFTSSVTSVRFVSYPTTTFCILNTLMMRKKYLWALLITIIFWREDMKIYTWRVHIQDKKF